MPTTNLGQVRDKITAIEWTSNSAGQPQGTAGTVDTYTIKTECSPAGAGTFSIVNGNDGNNGSHGSNGTNGTDATSLVGSGSLSIISGANLKSFIDGVGYNNVFSVWCKKTNENNWFKCKLDASFANNGNPLSGYSINVLSASYVDAYGSIINIVETPTSNFGDYDFCCTYYGPSNTMPIGYNLGQKYTLDSILSEALSVYNGGTFANIVKLYPFCFGKILNRNITIFPVTAFGSVAQLLYFDNGKFGFASTSDTGSTWTKQEAAMASV